MCEHVSTTWELGRVLYYVVTASNADTTRIDTVTISNDHMSSIGIGSSRSRSHISRWHSLHQLVISSVTVYIYPCQSSYRCDVGLLFRSSHCQPRDRLQQWHTRRKHHHRAPTLVVCTNCSKLTLWVHRLAGLHCRCFPLTAPRHADSCSRVNNYHYSSRDDFVWNLANINVDL